MLVSVAAVMMLMKMTMNAAVLKSDMVLLQILDFDTAREGEVQQQQ